MYQLKKRVSQLAYQLAGWLDDLLEKMGTE